jgi:tubulin-specific chaperone E
LLIPGPSISWLGFIQSSFKFMATASVGTRVNLNNNIGTIKYAGPVNNTTGIWLGIEWDDPARGIHDGSKDGKQYFTCR